VRTLHKNIVVLIGCLGLLFSVAYAPPVGAQTKTKKTTKAKESTDTAANKTPVDLNMASEQDLVDLPGIGPALAKKIIAGRPYSSVSELSKAGLSARTAKKIAPLVTVSGGAAAAAASAKAPAPAPASQPSPAAPNQSAPATPAKPVAPSASVGTPGPGMVWVNVSSGVYHYSGSQFYGKTKNGKYMSEDDAVKAGYHAAKNEKKPQ
jgi:ribosomal protein L13E